jgi:hypothetical protein
MSPLPIDQAFVLPKPVTARFAQLQILSTYADTPTTVVLGEWKVIASPGFVPSDTPLNIADPALGGHIVWMDPQQTDPSFPDGLLSEDPTLQTIRVPDGTRPSWVIGFQHDRAAQISELQWLDPQGSVPKTRFDRVDVEVSLTSPLGPWQSLGTWELQRADDGSVQPFTLDGPTWARFIRFTGNGPEGEDRDWEYPATLRVIEQATGEEYRSIFAEWGQDNPAGIYELLNPPDLTSVTAGPDDNNTPETASPLPANSDVNGRVHIGEDDDWYMVTAPDDQNTLVFSVGGTPTVGVKLTLYDSSGTEIPMSFSQAEGGGATYTATVTPGETYRVKVEQPPHSVVFAFDTSGSMGNYEPFVQQGLRAFSASVKPGQEFVNILPFDGQPLLAEWTDQPYLLQTAINSYVDQILSSSAETGLIDGSQLLAGQEGARAILIVTDAETSSYDRGAELWRTMDGVRPIIFSVHVGANSTPIQARHFMQDWAMAAGGYYQYTRSHGEMDRAFDRLATWLRRPAAYTISYTASTQDPVTPTAIPTQTPESTQTPEPSPTPEPTRTPEPTQTPIPTATPSAQASTKRGSLQVVSAPSDGSDSGATISSQIAVEIILDTSGSMLQEIEPGQRRIDVAKSVLTDLVTSKLPAGAPVALRVFGSQPDSCDTTLASPLQPLDPGTMAAQIDSLEVVNLVKTPLGFALQQVASDLAGVDGPKIVVLVTDGEETCGGDPAAAIQGLIDQGIDVQVNIVGFALDDEQLKETFRSWARIGNGSYFDATNAAELDEAIAKAASAPFRVYDQDGKVVASGTVDGSPVRLPAGTYTVVVLTDPETRFKKVEITGGERTKVTIVG